MAESIEGNSLNGPIEPQGVQQSCPITIGTDGMHGGLHGLSLSPDAAYRSMHSVADSAMNSGTPQRSAEGSDGCARAPQQPSPPPGKQPPSPSPSQQQPSGWGNAVVQIEEESSSSKPWSVYFASLPKKLRGGLDTRLPIPGPLELFWSWAGAFIGILAVSALNEWASPEVNIAFTVGSFGASAVLIYAMLESKMAQPRNFIGGQLISATVGITTRVIIHQPWIASPVAMSLALLAMQLTATTHPPGGATALIAASFETLPKWSGYSYLITIGVGSLVMQIIALIVNNLNPRRRYPTYWW